MMLLAVVFVVAILSVAVYVLKSSLAPCCSACRVGNHEQAHTEKCCCLCHLAG